jgi:hypothetical protein
MISPPHLLPLIVRLPIRALLVGVGLLIIDASFAHSQDLLITEIVADDEFGIRDADGELQDWIEIYNPHSKPVSLEGWHLTDSPDRPTLWTFPAGSIPAQGFVVVFASGKDRRDPAREWHTNFRLDKDGEYLALVRPDGVSISAAFSPQFPPQIPGASFGVGMTVDRYTLVTDSQPARLEVPTGPTSFLEWTLPGFDDSGWTIVQLPIGYEHPPDDGGGSGEPAADVTQPRDPIWPTSYNSPGGEGVEMAIDNNPSTKYLNFDKLNAGFTVTPTLGATVLTGLRFTSANDAPERDPTSFTLDGSNDGVQFTRIAQGAIPDFPARFFTVVVSFENQQRFEHYRLLFPTVRDAAAANSVQIAEVEFLGRAGPPPPAFADLILTDVEPLLFDKSPSAFVRLPFHLPTEAPLDNLFLQVRYDDGFAAYLNGVLVATANAPANLTSDSTAILDRPSIQSVRAESFSIADHIHLLQPGPNLLAFHALNHRSDSPEFLLGAELINLRITTGNTGFFQVPTPGEINAERSTGRVATPTPSLPRGFHPAPIQLSLSSDTEGAIIRFTLDGRTPSPSVGHFYIGPFLLPRGGPVRAVAFKEGWIPSETTTHTYLVLDEIIQQDAAGAAARGFPPLWGSTTADYEMDPSMVRQDGEDAYGGRYAQTIRDDLLSLPSISLVMQLDDLFGPTGIYSNPENRGPAWERPVSIELFDPNDPDANFQVHAGIRIQGGAFRRFDLTKKKSFRVVFRRTYGPGMLDYPLFGPKAAARFNNFILRANSNDAWPYGDANALYIRDAFAMETARAMGNVAPHTRFMHLYINGLYWGLYNPVERPDAAFSAAYHGGDRDSWDALNQDGLVNGTADAWNRLLNALTDNLADPEPYQRLQGRNPDGSVNPDHENLLDVDNLIDYMILNFYIGNADWPHRNFWIGRDRNDSHGFQFYPWDSETALGFTSLNTDRTGVADSVARPYAAARANAEFRMRFADRAHHHFTKGGALYVNPAQPAWNPEQPETNRPAERLARLASLVEAAMVGEAARWGDQMGRGPYTRDHHWAQARNHLLLNYLPRRSAIVLDQFRAAGLYPRTAAPALNHRGGHVEPGFSLTLTAPEGTIFFTLDGSDPRHPDAFAYTAPIPLWDLTTVKARAFHNDQWSALSEATFLIGQPRLIITELHYHPLPPTAAEQAAGFTNNDDFEFVELHNAGSGSLDLRRLRFVDGVTFDFAASPFTTLAPGQYLLLVQNRDAFQFRYGIDYPIAGQYSGRFSNAGERIEIADTTGLSLLAFTYGTRAPWPRSPDGQGPSLTLADWDGDPNDPASWNASEISGGTPARNPPARPLHIKQVERREDILIIHFTALAGKSYSLRSRQFVTAPWSTIRTLPAMPEESPRQLQIDWDPARPSAFFQLVQEP